MGYKFGGANIWRGLYMEGLIFRILRYSPFQNVKFGVPVEKSTLNLHKQNQPQKNENKLKEPRSAKR